MIQPSICSESRNPPTGVTRESAAGGRTGRFASTFILVLLLLTAVLIAGCEQQEDEAATTDTTADAGTAETTGDQGTTTIETAEVPTGDGGDGTGSPAAAVADQLGASVVQVAVARDGGGDAQVAGQGSGVIYTSDGIIITNNHVVTAGGDGPAARIAITLATGETHEGEVIGTDALTDLAVVRIDAADLPAAPFRQDLSDLTVGEYAIAIGNPLGFEGSVTLGVVSGIERELNVPGTQLFTDLIQTDAPISPGNSGGALADEQARVIGINVAALPPTQTRAQNIGFAIPSDLVVQVVDRLIADGEVRYGFLGIRSHSVTAPLQQQLGLERSSGVLVLAVGEGTAAAEAGLQQGDIIVEFNGQEIENQTDLFSLLREHEPGETVTLTVSREGETRTVEATLDERPQ